MIRMIACSQMPQLFEILRQDETKKCLSQYILSRSHRLMYGDIDIIMMQMVYHVGRIL